MDSEIVFVMTLLGLVASLTATFMLNDRLLKREPKAQPFRWGYYQAGCTIVGAFWIAAFIIEESYGMDPSALLGLFLVIGAYGTSAALLFQRKRLGVILVSILTLNPVSWGINYYYFKKRWAELTPMNATSQAAPESGTQDSGTPEPGPSATQGLRARPAVPAAPVARTALTPPDTHHGRWANEHYTVILLPGDVEVFEHGVGSMHFPPSVNEDRDAHSYTISYDDPYTRARVSYAFSLESERSLLFSLDRDGLDIEARERLERMGA